MTRLRSQIDPARALDVVLGAGAAGYILGFVAAIEAALARLAY